MTRLSCHRFRSNEVRLWLSVIAYNLGNPVAASGAAKEDRRLVADEPTAAVGKDRRPTGQARAVLLPAAGGEPSHATVVRNHSAQD